MASPECIQFAYDMAEQGGFDQDFVKTFIGEMEAAKRKLREAGGGPIPPEDLIRAIDHDIEMKIIQAAQKKRQILIQRNVDAYNRDMLGQKLASVPDNKHRGLRFNEVISEMIFGTEGVSLGARQGLVRKG